MYRDGCQSSPFAWVRLYLDARYRNLHILQDAVTVSCQLKPAHKVFGVLWI